METIACPSLEADQSEWKWPVAIVRGAEPSILVPTVASVPFELSEQQGEAKALILEFLKGPAQEFRLGGFAGTGKTTLIKELLTSIKGTAVGVAAFTGKAVHVLRTKGVWRASTLHSLLYMAEYNHIKKKMEWIRKTILPFDVVIIDEASMVSAQLYEDLRAHGVKLIFIGDPAQLEPVGDNPNLMRTCDYVLTDIHRQAKKSPILRMATALRKGRTDFPLGSWGNNEVGQLTVTDSIYGIDLADFDMTICAKNMTRHGINTKRRNQLERYEGPEVGEQIICLKNEKNVGVFNGMLLTIKDITNLDMLGVNPGFEANLDDEIDGTIPEVPILREFFGKDYKQDGRRLKGIPFDYGYCLTAHKSQGSEWGSVLVLDEPLYKTDQARWRYTSVTRAAKNLTFVIQR